MLFDFFITIWNGLYTAIAFAFSLPMKLFSVIKKLFIPTKKIKRK